jgi:hypothetical protein
MKKENRDAFESICLEKKRSQRHHVLRAPASERRVGDLDERVAVE